MMKKASQSKAAAAKRRRRVVKPKRRAAKKPEFIDRLKGVFRIVGDIESPIEPGSWECS